MQTKSNRLAPNDDPMQDRARLARHVIFRSIAIFLTGLAINRLPDYNLHTLRIPGVLQRIALCYLCVFSVSP